MIALKRLVLAWLQGLAELLLYYPVLVALHAFVPHMTPAFPSWLASLSGFYMLGFLFYAALPNVWRWLALLAALAIPAAAAWLMSGPSLLVVLVHYILWLLAWVRGGQNRRWGWTNSFPSGLLWIGMIGYFLASFLYPHFSETAHYAVSITVFGLLSLGLTLYRANSLTLRSESVGPEHAERSVSSETKWRNRFLVFAVFAAIVFIAAFGAIASAVKRAASFVFFGAIDLIRRLFSLFDKESGVSEPPPPMDSSPGLLPVEEPSAFALFMEKVLYWAVAILLVFAALWLLFIAGKYAKRWLKRFMGWYGERLEAPKEGYVDEKQSLLDAREWVRAQADQVKRRFVDAFRKQPGWDELADNRERVRHAYRRLLLNRIAAGYKHSEARTPHETGVELERRAPLDRAERAAIPLYEDVRYGGKDVSDEQAEAAGLRSLFGSEGGKRP